MSDDKMRAEFEAWAARNSYPLEKHMGNRYWYNDTNRVWKAWQAACEQQQAGGPVAWDSPEVDPIVTKLYRKFKEWNEREFTADDVTWCEVRSFVAELLNASPQPQPDWVLEKKLWDVLDAAIDELERRAAPHAWISKAWEAGRKVIMRYRENGLKRPQPPEGE